MINFIIFIFYPHQGHISKVGYAIMFLDKYCLGNETTNTMDIDFFDSSYTFAQESIQVGCCARDTTLTNVTCGQGISCKGQCSAIEASLCPSSNCTMDPKDCMPNRVVAQDDGRVRSYATLPSWVFNWCTHRCPVRYHTSCCFHPTCRRLRGSLCNWMNYLTGRTILLFLNFHERATLQAALASHRAPFPTVSGAARCRKSPFLTPLSWTVTPIPTAVSKQNTPKISP